MGGWVSAPLHAGIHTPRQVHPPAGTPPWADTAPCPVQAGKQAHPLVQYMLGYIPPIFPVEYYFLSQNIWRNHRNSLILFSNIGSLYSIKMGWESIGLITPLIFLKFFINS